jgi:hypothetical protein
MSAKSTRASLGLAASPRLAVIRRASSRALLSPVHAQGIALTITTRPQRRSRFHSHIALFEFGFGPFANHNQYPNSGLPITW